MTIRNCLIPERRRYRSQHLAKDLYRGLSRLPSRPANSKGCRLQSLKRPSNTPENWLWLRNELETLPAPFLILKRWHCPELKPKPQPLQGALRRGTGTPWHIASQLSFLISSTSGFDLLLC